MSIAEQTDFKSLLRRTQKSSQIVLTAEILVGPGPNLKAHVPPPPRAAVATLPA